MLNVIHQWSQKLFILKIISFGAWHEVYTVSHETFVLFLACWICNKIYVKVTSVGAV